MGERERREAATVEGIETNARRRRRRSL